MPLMALPKQSRNDAACQDRSARLANTRRCQQIRPSDRNRRTSMNPIVAVIAPGMMGAAVGKRLVDHGVKVLTSLTGRSAETKARADSAGMVSASDEEIAA